MVRELSKEENEKLFVAKYILRHFNDFSGVMEGEGYFFLGGQLTHEGRAPFNILRGFAVDMVAQGYDTMWDFANLERSHREATNPYIFRTHAIGSNLRPITLERFPTVEITDSGQLLIKNLGIAAKRTHLDDLRTKKGFIGYCTENRKDLTFSYVDWQHKVKEVNRGDIGSLARSLF